MRRIDLFNSCLKCRRSFKAAPWQLKESDGKLEARHILPWSEFPELRYNLANGITLCHAHHPKKRVEAAKRAPIFKELVTATD